MNHHDLAQRLATGLTAGGLTGSAVAVVTASSMAVAVSGAANIERGQPVGADTVFRIASVTKTMTAIAVMQLVEQGQVQLDDDMNQHLTSYRIEQVGPRPVTVRDLLRHTGGIGEWARWREALHPVRGLGPRFGEPIPSIPSLHGPVLHVSAAPGQRFGYANHGFLTLGQLVHDVTGVSLARHLADHLFAPSAMALSCGEPLTANVGAHLAMGYRTKKSQPVPYEFRHEVGGDGDVYASIGDMARYGQMLLRGGQGPNGRVLEASSLQEMWTPQFRLGGVVPLQGLAFTLRTVAGCRTVSHGGNITGFHSSLLVAPDAGFALVAMVNQSANSPATAATESGLCQLMGAPRSTDWDQLEQPLDRDVRAWACGDYHVGKGGRLNLRYYGTFGGRITVTDTGQHLTLQGRLGMLKGPFRLHPIDASDPTHFRFEHEGIGTDVWFIQQADGTRTVVVDRINAVFHTARS
jgi:CubicO group peptidase (beta-lactamase class C family)